MNIKLRNLVKLIYIIEVYQYQYDLSVGFLVFKKSGNIIK